MATSARKSKRKFAYILERDANRCAKCLTRRALQVHHIVARQDGGSDEPSNLIVLCEMCHKEWHGTETATRSFFDEWLLLPPVGLMVKVISSTPDVSTKVMMDAWRILKEIRRSFQDSGVE